MKNSNTFLSDAEHIRRTTIKSYSFFKFLQDNRIQFCYPKTVCNDITDFLIKDVRTKKNICAVSTVENTIYFIDSTGSHWDYTIFTTRPTFPANLETIEYSKTLAYILSKIPENPIKAIGIPLGALEENSKVVNMVGIRIVENLLYFKDTEGNLWPFVKEIKI